ncbi:hypothetical protein [Halorubrum sp. DTA98]|uniref:hypothetical protein n=1 Tax=Halorubrum sp. DTA98 TaxID=3402163 RepID=UPI003AB0621D
MSKGIIFDDLKNVVSRLKSSDFDDSEFAYEQYTSGRSAFDVAGDTIHTIQGEVTYPRGPFSVKFDDLIDSATKITESPPGVLPYLKGAKQLKGTNPSPRDVGLPCFTGDSNIGIRWLFDTSGTSGGSDFTEWGRLDKDTVKGLNDIEIPEKDPITDMREDASVSPGFTHPEDPRVVEGRINNYWWEVWCARCQELMDSWRVILPAGTNDTRPLVLAPHNTIVSNNFNFILFESGSKAVAAAAVLGSEQVQNQVHKIVPWSKGGTARPGVKHYRALLHQHRSKIEDIVDDDAGDVTILANQMDSVHESLMTALRGYVSDPTGNQIRDYYSAIPSGDALEYEIEGIKPSGDDEVVCFKTSEGEVEVGFSDEADKAASAGIAGWLAAARGDTVDDVLDLPVFSSDPDTVRSVLYETGFDTFRQKIVNDYL